MTTSRGGAGRRRVRRDPDTMRKCAQKLTDLALDTLEEIMKGEVQAAVKLAAAREVLDRGYGRPKLGEPQDAAEGLTVVVRRFTDAPDPEAGKFPEVEA